jgi:flagellar motility protein MotE (MotC chaperone)
MMRLCMYIMGMFVCQVALAAEHGAPAEGAAAAAATTVSESVIKVGEQSRTFSETEVQVLQELDGRRLELDRREQALELREKLVDLMENKLNTRVGELNTLKAELEKMLGSVSGKDDKELMQLAQMYANMKPGAAAVVLNRLDNPIVLDVLVRMPAKKSGKLLEALDPIKARFLSEMLARQTPVMISPTGL